MGRWELGNHGDLACERAGPAQLGKPAAYFPTACPVNAKTKHTCLLPAGGQWAKMSVLEG